MNKVKNPSQKLINVSKNIVGLNVNILVCLGRGGSKVSKDSVYQLKRRLAQSFKLSVKSIWNDMFDFCFLQSSVDIVAEYAVSLPLL